MPDMFDIYAPDSKSSCKEIFCHILINMYVDHSQGRNVCVMVPMDRERYQQTVNSKFKSIRIPRISLMLMMWRVLYPSILWSLECIQDRMNAYEIRSFTSSAIKPKLPVGMLSKTKSGVHDINLIQPCCLCCL